LDAGFREIEDRNPNRDHTEMDNSKGKKNLLSSVDRRGLENKQATEDAIKEIARSRE
jgi:hypothetical protein